MGMTCVSWWTWSSRRSNLPPVGDNGGRPMARRTFDVIDVTEILMHWHAGRSKNEMAESLGVDRKTLRKYIAPAEAAGIAPGGPAKSEQEWAELVRGWFPQLADTRLRQVTWPAIGKHHDYITAQLKAGVRMSTIHQRLRDEQGLAVSPASFRRYVAANVPEETRRSQVVVWNPRPAEAGELEHPGFGGDSILPRCSGLGGRCLPRYRRLAEPWSDHFPAFVLSNICPAALSRCPRLVAGSARHAPAGGLGHLLVGHPRCAPRVP